MSVSIKVGGQDKLDHLIVTCQLNISPVGCRHSFNDIQGQKFPTLLIKEQNNVPNGTAFYLS